MLGKISALCLSLFHFSQAWLIILVWMISLWHFGCTVDRTNIVGRTWRLSSSKSSYKREKILSIFLCISQIKGMTFWPTTAFRWLWRSITVPGRVMSLFSTWTRWADCRLWYQWPSIYAWSLWKVSIFFMTFSGFWLSLDLSQQLRLCLVSNYRYESDGEDVLLGLHQVWKWCLSNNRKFCMCNSTEGVLFIYQVYH